MVSLGGYQTLGPEQEVPQKTGRRRRLLVSYSSSIIVVVAVGSPTVSPTASHPHRDKPWGSSQPGGPLL